MANITDLISRELMAANERNRGGNTYRQRSGNKYRLINRQESATKLREILREFSISMFPVSGCP